jgi:plastocyanin
MRRNLALLLACGALVTLGACGDDENTDTQTSATTTTETATGTTGTTETTGGESVEIEIKDFEFSPADASVKVGQTVTWKQEDSAPHDVDSQSGPEIKSPVMQKGQEYEFTAEEAGTVEYICSIHPQMKATLKITE